MGYEAINRAARWFGSVCSVSVHDPRIASAGTSTVVCTTGPNLNGVPISANVRFQKSIASCAACSRESCAGATKTMEGICVRSCPGHKLGKNAEEKEQAEEN